MLRHVVLTLGLLLATGCIHASVQRLDEAARPPRPAESVVALPAAPARPYTVIAVLETTGKSVFDSFADLQSDLVIRAAELGGDAVIVGPRATEAEFIFTGTAMIRSEERKLTGEVIVYGQPT